MKTSWGRNGFAQTPVRRKALAGAAAFAALASAVAQSQEVTTPAGAPAAPIEEVVVTGSRIAAPNLISTSPIQVVSSKDIQISGKHDIDDIIMQLPQNFDNGLGQDLGNRTSALTTPGGVATADLRGLGPNRTLVMVDGRRLGIGSPNTFIQSPAPDLDQIPTYLIDRVEVVTGGASATYGSDAIAGVINFIMKKDFQGFQVDGQIGANWHNNNDSYWQSRETAFGTTPPTGTTWDGQNRSFNLIAGTNFADGKGNVTAYISFLDKNPVAGSQRDWSACQATEVRDAAGDVIDAKCGGSSNSNWFSPETGANAGNIYSVLGSSFIPRGSAVTSPPASFNSQPYIYMTRQDTRYNAGFMAHEDVTDYFKPYADFSFMQDKTHQAIAPSALFKDSNPFDPNTGNYNINCSNPLLSAQEAGVLCTPAQIAADLANPGSVTANVQIGRRNVEGGGRISDYEHTNYRAAFGTKGNIADGWEYDAYGQIYYVGFFTSNSNYLSFQRIDNALLVKGTAANPVCIIGGACVPYNPFTDSGITAAQTAYLAETGTATGTYTMRTLHAEVTGQLGKYGIQLPTAHDGIGVNFGLEHRNEKQTHAPDAAEQSGDIAGAGSAAVPIDSTDSVTEEWLEVRVPLIQDMPFAKDLVFDTGFRRSDYSISGPVNTHKFELQYAPSSDLRFRGTLQTAIRAPTLIEFFNPQNVGLIQFGDDPCAATLNAAGQKVAAVASLQQCLHSVTAANQAAFTALYGNGSTTNNVSQATSGQLSQLSGGNPNLHAETSKSWTLGFTVTPQALPGFAASVDYFRITVEGEINTIPAATIMTNCLNAGDPVYCSQLVRNPNTGGLTGNNIPGGGYIVQTNVNIGKVLVSGLDVQANYKWELSSGGAVSFALNGALLQHTESTPLPGAPTYDCVGLFGLTCQTVNPRWHHIVRTTWLTPWNATASLTWRYIGSVADDNNSSDSALAHDAYKGIDYFSAHLPAMNYIDLAGTYAITGAVELRAGINNITDKNPPVIGVTIQPGGANAYSAYDQLGREVFVSFTAKF